MTPFFYSFRIFARIR